MSTRKESNLQIIELITRVIDEFPDMRFIQVLEALNLFGDFYEESQDTLDIAKETAIYRQIISKVDKQKLN